MKFLRHIFFSLCGTWPHFKKADLQHLEILVAKSEQAHSCQLGIAVEGTMSLWDLLSEKNCRQRAWEIFSLERFWDTERRVGLLLYISLAERDVEIVADRGIAAKLSEAELESFCRLLEANFREGRFISGIENLLLSLNPRLARDFPADKNTVDEVPSRVSVY